MSDHEETLRKLTVRDDAYVDLLLADERANEAAARLDGKTRALVRVAALIAVDAATPSYMEAIEVARRWGASNDEVAGCLVALLPTVGVARIVSAAPKVALALGYDVEAALESRADQVPHR
ncbi:MAG: hypothetical protein ACM33B_00140 [Pseudomonadota bacterium]